LCGTQLSYPSSLFVVNNGRSKGFNAEGAEDAEERGAGEEPASTARSSPPSAPSALNPLLPRESHAA